MLRCAVVGRLGDGKWLSLEGSRGRGREAGHRCGLALYVMLVDKFHAGMAVSAYVIQMRFQIRGNVLHRGISTVATDKAYPLPGMIYVNDRKPDSICDTALAFFVTNSPYM